MQCLPQSLKSTFFENFLESLKDTQSEENIEKMLLLVFEVIMKPPKQKFEIVIFFYLYNLIAYFSSISGLMDFWYL